MRRYPAYRDSGVEWLGEVPEGWDILRFRHVFQESSETIANEVFGPMLSVSGYRGIEVKEYDDENRRRSEEDLVGYRIVRPGQLVVNTMWLNNTGLGVSDFEGHVSPAYRAYFFRGDADRRFVHHAMRSHAYVQGYTKHLTGVRPNSLQMSRDDLMDFPVLLPSRPEQQAIAAFLDRETAKIDALVAEQRRLIELLREKRQAVITHAVTRGLDPTAPLKPSGVEWLGDVPVGWEVVSLRHLVDPRRSITYGIVQPGEPDPEGRFMVRGQDYSAGWANGENIFRVSPAVEEPYKRARLVPGDLVMTIVGAGTGNVAEVPSFLDGANITQTTARIAPRSEKVFGRFLSWSLRSDVGRVQVQRYQKGAAQPGLNLEHLSAFLLPVPPLETQRSISDRLDTEFRDFSNLEREAESAISLLQERRAALISAAVTGRIDVRHPVPEVA